MRIAAVIGKLINHVFRREYTPPAQELKLPFPVEAPSPTKFRLPRRFNGMWRGDGHDQERIDAAVAKRNRRKQARAIQISRARGVIVT